MDNDEAIRLVRVVSDGMLRSRPEQETVAKLVVAGVPADKAPELFVTIKRGLLAGAQAAFTEGKSAPDGPPDDPLMAEAFRVGHAALHDSVRWVWLARLAIPVALVVLVLAVVFLGRSLGWWGE